MKKRLFNIILLGCCFTSLYAQIDNNKSQIKQERVEKRFIHPESKYLSISAGWGFTSTHIKDPNNFLNQGMIMQNNTFIPNLIYEHGFKNYFFVEFGYYYIGQGISVERMADGVGQSFYSGIYGSHDFHGGIGYRVIIRNNYHLFNLHAGAFIGLASKRLVDLPITTIYNRIDPITNLSYTNTTNITGFHPLSYGPYLGISKEIRLSQDVRFFVKYFQRFGMNTIMTGTFQLNSDEIDFDNNLATFKVRGGGAFITGGLKILLFKNKLDKYDE